MTQAMDHQGHSQHAEVEVQEQSGVMHPRSLADLEALDLHTASADHRFIMPEAEAVESKI
jgi:hypothetical protein